MNKRYCKYCGLSLDRDDWISVDDTPRLPKKHERVLVAASTGFVSEGYLSGSFPDLTAYWHTEHRKYSIFHGFPPAITHWQPLPEAPQ